MSLCVRLCKFAILNHPALKLDEKVSSAKDHGQNYMNDKPPGSPSLT